MRFIVGKQARFQMQGEETMADIQVFDAVMNKDEIVDGANVIIPYDVEAVHHAKRVKVKATFDDAFYQGSIVRMNGVYVIGIPKAIRKQINKQPGEVLHVTIEEDTSVRTAVVPEDLRIAFENSQTALKHFESLSYTNQRKICMWIEEAKKEETRAVRVQKSIEMLAEGKHR